MENLETELDLPRFSLEENAQIIFNGIKHLRNISFKNHLGHYGKINYLNKMF